jgi:hypothetical protein
VDDWKDEMYLRMVRGFYNYFHPLTKVGITLGWPVPMPGESDVSLGRPALIFIRDHYDFAFFYIYTPNLDFFLKTIGNYGSVKDYYSVIDQLFIKQEKFWILTRIWDLNKDVWEYEAIALEMKNCLDRNIAITLYYKNNPPIAETWPMALKCIELYNRNATYYETRVYGKNSLTGYIGETYGWVEVP